MINKCPGQDSRKIEAREIKCLGCGYGVEIFSDEVKVKCPKCGGLVCQERLPSCVEWCKHNRDCVGETLYENHRRDKSLILKEKLLKELEEYFGADIKRINHARKVMCFAEELLKHERADWNIVIPSSILHDVGIKAAEKKYGSSAGRYQEKEGPEIARAILLKLGLGKEDIDEIVQIIAHHHSPGVVNSLNFKVLYDADWLVNLKDEVTTDDIGKLKEVIGKVFLTETGRRMAEDIYTKKEEGNAL